MPRLGPEFYEAPTLQLAGRLLGKIFVRAAAPGRPLMKARIVETEAYCGSDDAASHAFRGVTARNAAMFGPAGRLYIYFSYGCHFMANIVTGEAGTPGAVLLRAMEPLEGIEEMRRRRNRVAAEELMSGPGKLTRALGIGMELYGESLTAGECWLEDAAELAPELIGSSPRIGITKAVELPWRRFVIGSAHLSKTRPSPLPEKGRGALEC